MIGRGEASISSHVVTGAHVALPSDGISGVGGQNFLVARKDS